MNWPLILVTGSITLGIGGFLGLIIWANWDELTKSR